MSANQPVFAAFMLGILCSVCICCGHDEFLEAGFCRGPDVETSDSINEAE